MVNRKAAFHTLGCKVNAYETEAMQELLQGEGYEIVPFDEKADVYVINTCAVTNIAERKSRQMLHRAKKLNPEAVVVAAGCYVQVKQQEAEEDEAVDLVLGSGQKHMIADVLRAYFAGNGMSQAKELAIAREYDSLEISSVIDRTRAFIKVQDGCNQFCSYCIIPFARGRVRSRQPGKVREELERLSEAGIQEVVLTGIHLSSYGRDWDDTPHLAGLVEMAAGVPGISRIRLSSLEPRIITEDFAARLAATGKVCPHFHLSLQSGCASTLRRMNRHYTPEEYRDKCAILRKTFDRPAVTTDVIVGFPGETEDEFLETKAFLEDIAFYEMHVFKYSRRKGTRADLMDGQVPEEVKTERSAQLLALTRAQSKAFRSSMIGSETEVLLEEAQCIDGQTYMTGFNPQYVRCAVRLSDPPNTIVKGVVRGFLRDDLMLLVTDREA